ncbi:MAG: MarR family winged helix-turn-helix transcriptional regulator [Sphaerochaeta sp.]
MHDTEMKAHVFGSLFLIANKLQVLGDQIDEQVSTKQWLLLAVLLSSDSQECMLSELAAKTGSSRQNIKKMAQILERRGFLELAQSEKDKRAVLVRPTQACFRHLKTREADEKAFVEAFFAGFESAALEAMYHSIRMWMENLQRMEEMYEKGE